MEKDSIKKKLIYGCGDIYGGGAFLIISLLFLNYLTDVELMAPALAGGIIMIGKVWDAVTDPVMGYISDNTKSRFGRRRVYFLFGIIPVFITFTLLWYSFGMVSGNSKFLYYLIMYILFNTSFTLIMVPYNSILPDITTDYKERTSYTGVRMLFSISSAILAGVLPMIIIKSNSDIKMGYLTMAVFFATLYALPWLIVFFGTKEKIRDEQCKSNVNLYKQLISVFKNKSFKIHAGIFICAQTAVDFLTTLFIYYLTNCIGRQKEFPIVLGILLITQLLVMPINIKIAKKKQKTSPLKFGFMIWIVALITSLFLSPKSPSFLIYMVAALSGFGTSVSVLVPWSILPEIADVDEIITSKRREGIYSGMATLLRKMANGLSIGVIGIALQLFDYIRPSSVGEVVVQSTSTVLGIKILFAFVPIFFILLSLFFSSKYSMTEERYKILKEEVIRLRNGGSKKDVQKKTKEVIEKLTGLNYKDIWEEIK